MLHKLRYSVKQQSGIAAWMRGLGPGVHRSRITNTRPSLPIGNHAHADQKIFRVRFVYKPNTVEYRDQSAVWRSHKTNNSPPSKTIISSGTRQLSPILLLTSPHFYNSLSIMNALRPAAARTSKNFITRRFVSRVYKPKTIDFTVSNDEALH